VRTDIVPDQNDVRPATAKDLGISRKAIHEARLIRDAEKAELGIVKAAHRMTLLRGLDLRASGRAWCTLANISRAL
jgi:hypothetical protein